MQIRAFTFNPFSENTYVLYDETGEAVLVDPGCAFPEEEKELQNFILDNKLTVKKILLTHAHIDHVLGCDFVAKSFGVGVLMHKDDLFLLQRASDIGKMYGVSVAEPPMPEGFMSHGDAFSFGNSTLEVRFTPGHSPGSISFIHLDSRSVFSGDVLFSGSVGRTDLPGGNMDVLLESVRNQLFSLPDDFVVFSGHGPVTNIGTEKRQNPFFKL
jgi:glyoxylase-like metal-dependent hydrolase (beta-lactamase superfamily II)